MKSKAGMVSQSYRILPPESGRLPDRRIPAPGETDAGWQPYGGINKPAFRTSSKQVYQTRIPSFSWLLCGATERPRLPCAGVPPCADRSD